MRKSELIQFGDMIRRTSELTSLHKLAQNWKTRALIGGLAGGLTGAGTSEVAGGSFPATVGSGAIGAAGGALAGLASGHGAVDPKYWAYANKALRSKSLSSLMPLGTAMAGGLAGGLVPMMAGLGPGASMMSAGVGALAGGLAGHYGRKGLLDVTRNAARDTAASDANVEHAMEYYKNNIGRAADPAIHDLARMDPEHFMARKTILDNVYGMDGRTADNLLETLINPNAFATIGGVNAHHANAAKAYARDMLHNPAKLMSNAADASMIMPSNMSTPQRFFSETLGLGPNYLQDYAQPLGYALAGYAGLKGAGNIYNTFAGNNQEQQGGRRVVIV